MSNPPNIEQVGPQARIQAELLRSESLKTEFWILPILAGMVVFLGVLTFFFPHHFWYSGGLHISLSPQGLFVIMVAMVLASLVYSRRDLRMRGLQLANLQQRMSAEKMRAERMIDPVTKVFPRGFLDDLLAREISLAERRNRPLALIMSNVNNFKQVNARYGHLMGDYVLSQIATILQSCVRGSDYVVRYGEHQFLVLLPETDYKGSEIVRQRVHRKVSEWDRTQRVGDLPISVSLGWYLHVTGQTAEKDIAEADACMYAANQATQPAAAMNPLPPPQQPIPLEM